MDFRDIRAAFDLLGIVFCAQCGRPHRAHGGERSFLYLRRADGDDGLLAVCVDQPEALACLLKILHRTEDQVEGPPVKVAYRDLPGSIARWILDAGAYARSSPMHGAVTDCLMTGDAGINTEDLAFSLLYWRKAKFGGVVAGESNRKLLQLCGWEPTDAEYARVIERCRTYAEEHGHHDQRRHFAAVRTLTGREAWPERLSSEV